MVPIILVNGNAANISIGKSHGDYRGHERGDSENDCEQWIQ